jgi:hypothetical protein
VSRCPKCNSEDVRLSRTRNRWERWRRDISGRRPYRCRACNWRGWLVIDDTEMDRANRRSMAPDPPNLKGTLLARPDADRTIDLKALDRFHSAPEKDDA